MSDETRDDQENVGGAKESKGSATHSEASGIAEPAAIDDGSILFVEPAAEVDDDDPAFRDETPDGQEPTEAREIIDEDEEQAPRRPPGNKLKLAAAVIGFFPIFCGVIYVLGSVLAPATKRPSSARSTSYPDAPFQTTTDKPMTGIEIEAWLAEKPKEKADRFEALSKMQKRTSSVAVVSSSPVETTQPPPGFLFVPEKGRAIALDSSQTPLRRTDQAPAPASKRWWPPRTRRRSVAEDGASAVESAVGTLREAVGPVRLPFEGGSESATTPFIYETAGIQNSDVFLESDMRSAPPPSRRLPLDVGDLLSRKASLGPILRLQRPCRSRRGR